MGHFLAHAGLTAKPLKKVLGMEEWFVVFFVVLGSEVGLRPWRQGLWACLRLRPAP
jgi:hypothetical protein